jgi:hypothetical protein
VIKSLVTAFALAKAAAMGFNLVMAVNPFAAAIIGATAFLALLTSIKQLEDERKNNEKKTAENEAAAKKIDDLHAAYNQRITDRVLLEKELAAAIARKSAADTEYYQMRLQEARNEEAIAKMAWQGAGSKQLEHGVAGTHSTNVPSLADSKDDPRDKELERMKKLAEGYTEVKEKEKKADQEFLEAHLDINNDIANAEEEITAAEKKLSDERIEQNKKETDEKIKNQEKTKAASWAFGDSMMKLGELAIKSSKAQAQEKKALLYTMAVVEAAAAATKGIVQVWTDNTGGSVWGNIAMTAVVAADVVASAWTQIDAISSASFAKGALVKGGRGGVTAQVGEADQDELVLPMKTGVAELADRLIQQIGSIVMPQPRYAFAGAGGAGVQRKTEIHWHIGTLVADDRSLKELERRQMKFRVSEQQRKGEI